MEIEFEEKEATSTKNTLRFSPALREGLELNLIHDYRGSITM